MAKTPKKDTGKPTPQFGKGQPKSYCGKKGRSGGARDMRTTIRHGLKAGQLPKNARYIQYQINALRRQLEDAVTSLKGRVTLLDAASIQTAIKWERHGALCLRWLRLEGDTLKPSERLQFSRDIARASAERDKSLALLGLDAPPKVIDLTDYIDGNGDDK